MHVRLFLLIFVTDSLAKFTTSIVRETVSSNRESASIIQRLRVRIPYSFSYHFAKNIEGVMTEMEQLARSSKRFLRKNASTILTCIGGVGVVATTVMAIKATPKATQLIRAAEEEKGEKLTRMETIKIAGPTYAPTALLGISTIGSIFGANALNKHSQAALMSAYALVDQTFRDYKTHVEDEYGEEANAHIREKIANDRYVERKTELGGETKLFYDFYSGRYFNSTMEKVLAAEFALNRQIILGECAYLNDFYQELGLPLTDIGDEVGWSRGHMCETYEQEWVDFNHQDVTQDDGLECCIITFMQDPAINFADYC